jgi:dTDP-4-amino-4,6-dideoxygalactose transaminase
LLPLAEMNLSRNELLLELRNRNIGASIHYAPLHLMSLYRDIVQQPVLPNTEAIYERIITLPISASMNMDDADYIIEQLKELIS